MAVKVPSALAAAGASNFFGNYDGTGNCFNTSFSYANNFKAENVDPKT